MPMNAPIQKTRIRLDGFDLFVLAGAMVNLVVVCYLVAYWFFYG